jgi:hypothetical protein
MAAILPLSDRRARLGLVLALLGLPSVGVTLPAAVWLGLGSLRQERLASGGEPAMGFLALAVAALDSLFVYQALARLVPVIGPAAVWASLAWGVLLASAVLVLAVRSLRIHPERRIAALAARSALIASAAGGTALLVRLLAIVRA